MNPLSVNLRNCFRKFSQIAAAIRAIVVSSILGGNLAALTLIFRPLAAVNFIQYGLFGWNMIKGRGLPYRQFHELFETPDYVSVCLLPTKDYLTYWDANYTKDMLYLTLLVRLLSPKTIFEIGTLNGYSALLFALNSPPETKIFTLDLPLDRLYEASLSTTIIDDNTIASHGKTTEYLYRSHPAGGKVIQLYGDSAQFDFTPYRGQVDLFFIDGAHSYEYVRSDSMRAFSCTRPGGIIIWHDYGRWGVNGVSKWLHELARDGKEIYRLPGSSLAILKMNSLHV